MLDKLKSLVFGFDEYEKAKIDERFLQILVILNNLEIREIKDFEILETVIFKIKELLRVKSSNLNTIIKNPKKKLTKKKVLEIVEKLDEIKYDFLKKAFLAIQSEKEKEDVDNKSKTNFNKQENKQNDFEVKQNLKVEDKILDKLEVYKNESFILSICNGKIPYLFLNFYDNVDYVLVKNLTSLFFEVYGMAGTNIIIEDNSVLIVPRYQNDNLFSLPSAQVNIDEVYSMLNKNSENKDVKVKQKDFIEIDENNVKRVNTSQKEDDSLDALLGGVEKKDFTVTHNSNQKDNEIRFEKSDSIEIEKDKKKEIEIEVKNNQQQVMEKVEEKIEAVPVQEKQSNIIKEVDGVEIFRDENIVCYLNKYSKVSGELVIQNVEGIRLKDLEEPKLTYMFMFAKALGAVLFEVKQAHGTNIVSDFEDSCIRVVPRYQDDNVGLNWDLTQADENSLEEVKHLLLSSMSSALNKDSVKTEKKVEKKVVENQEDNSRVKEKAQHILQSLRRIP